MCNNGTYRVRPRLLALTPKNTFSVQVELQGKGRQNICMWRVGMTAGWPLSVVLVVVLMFRLKTIAGHLKYYYLVVLKEYIVTNDVIQESNLNRCLTQPNKIFRLEKKWKQYTHTHTHYTNFKNRLAGACVAPGMCVVAALMASSDPHRGVASLQPHFSSVFQLLLLSFPAILTDLSVWAHCHFIKLQSYGQTQVTHVVKVVVSFVFR